MSTSYLCDSCCHYDTCKSGLKGRDNDCASYDSISPDKSEQYWRFNRDFPKSWLTFKGKRVSTSTIDHQHLSNCYWYLLVCQGLPKTHRMFEGIREVLADRFNGQLLPYRPHIDFKYEIDTLDRKSLLLITSNQRRTIIVFENEVIGEIIRPL